MNKHLKLVREFHDKYGIDQAEYLENTHLSDMDIVLRQALLLDCASETFKAIGEGDLAKILGGLIDLAYNALAAIACRGDDVAAVTVTWRQDGTVLSVMKALSDRINNCTSGETVHYSALYAICEHLARGFINADFDKAFRILHRHLLSQTSSDAARMAHAPDLSEALYE